MDEESDDVDIACLDGIERVPDLSEYEERLGRTITITHASLDEAEPEFVEILANGFASWIFKTVVEDLDLAGLGPLGVQNDELELAVGTVSYLYI